MFITPKKTFISFCLDENGRNSCQQTAIFGQYNGRRTCTVDKKVKNLTLDGNTKIM